MKKILITSLIMASTSLSAQVASDAKSPRELAKKLYISLTGTQPNRAELNYLEAKISNNDFVGAGGDIIDQKGGIQNGGAFYGVTIKDWVTPKFNKQRTTLAPLNDGAATIIGYIRDGRPFNQILYENVVYKASGVTFQGELWYFDTTYPASVPTASTLCAGLGTTANDFKIIYNDPLNPNSGTKFCKKTKFKKTKLDASRVDNALYIPRLDLIIETNLLSTTNRHYENIAEQGLDLSDPLLLVPVTQDIKLHAYPAAIAGLLSTRAYGSAYYYAGTNRAPVAYAMEHFLCKDMEELHDTTIPDFRNRRDVDRSPGGSSELYKNRCIGCHAGMDAMAGAFAYYDYTNGKVTYTPGSPVPKMNHNIVFPEGFTTSNDTWTNLWTQGHNQAIGWGSIKEGEGANSFGRMLASTEAFHSCMAKQAYEKVCMKKASSAIDKARVSRLTTFYKNSNFNLKRLFINASIECLED
jgi:hypothetical protein